MARAARGLAVAEAPHMAEEAAPARRQRFIRPEVTRIPLSDGDWIEVKAELGFGETQRMLASGFSIKSNLSQMGSDGAIALDLVETAFQKMLTWLVDWSLRDDTDKVLPISRASLEMLTGDTALEIDRAIEAHAKRVDASKKARSTRSTGP